jgi:hypothetical protein
MVVNTTGLQRKKTYDEVVFEIQMDDFKDSLKYPDRTAKWILEAPQMVALQDPEDTEAILQYEKNRRAHQARHAQVEEMAQERGVSISALERHTRPTRAVLEPVPDDTEFETRKMEHTMATSMATYSAAAHRAENVEKIRNTLKEQFAARSRVLEPHIADETKFYDLTTPPNEPEEIDLSLPSVPRRAASAVARGLVDSPRMLARGVIAAAPPTAEALIESGRLTAKYGPGIARATMSTIGYTGQALGLVARGMASGGQAATQAALAGTMVIASQVPASHRGRDFQSEHGVTTAGRLIRNAHASLL